MPRHVSRLTEEAFKSFVKSLGGWSARSAKDVGGFILASNNNYLWRIEMIVNTVGGCRAVFGEGYYTDNELLLMFSFAAKAVADARSILRAKSQCGRGDSPVLAAYSLPQGDNPDAPDRQE